MLHLFSVVVGGGALMFDATVLCSVVGNFEIEPTRRNPSIKNDPACSLVMTVERCEGSRSASKSGAS
jgi:hypothetical protein